MTLSLKNKNEPSKVHHIVSVTPFSEEEFREKSQLAIYMEKVDYPYFTIVTDNQEGLPKIYNTFLTEEHADKNIIFIHDDVLIEDVFFTEKLDIAFEKFDIVGLAGATACNLNKPIPAWHVMCEPNERVGEVAHAAQGKTWTSVFGPTDSRALVIDGLFIGVNVAKMLETGTKFDEDFDFHHYDISFCLNANKNKVKIGVAPIKVTHFGLGDSMNTPEWVVSADNFKKKYV